MAFLVIEELGISSEVMTVLYLRDWKSCIAGMGMLGRREK